MADSQSGHWPPIVSHRTLVVQLLEQDSLRATADVMHHLGRPRRAHHDADMRQARVEQPRKEISLVEAPGKTIARHGLTGVPKAGVGAREERLEIEYPAMIDICIGLPRPPDPASGIVVEGQRHALLAQF